MKKLTFLFVSSAIIALASCGDKTANAASVNDSDSVAVDTLVVDTLAVDSVCAD